MPQIMLAQSIKAASYPDVSLLMKMCAQRKAGRGHLYPSHGPLRFITSHSRFALAMRKTKRLRRRLPLKPTMESVPRTLRGQFLYLAHVLALKLF